MSRVGCGRSGWLCGRSVRRVVWVWLAAVLAAGCVSSGGSGGSLVVGEVEPPAGAPAADDAAADDAAADDTAAEDGPGGAAVSVGESGAAGGAGEAEGVLVLVGAGADWLMVRWGGDFAPGAAGFRLAWREASAADGGPGQSSVDLAEGVLERRIGGLAAGTEYWLRLSALDGEGAPGASAAATFATLAPPVRGLAAAPAEVRGLRLSWDAPQGWAPAGYVLRWRERGGGESVGEVSLGASARSHVVTDLAEGVEYVARVSPLNTVGREGDPADLDVAVAAGGLVVLAGAGADWLMVRWAERFAPGAAGFRLAWREASAGDGGPGQPGVGLVEGARERRVAGLAAGTRYRLRLVALSAVAAPGAAAEAVFSTPAPPVLGLAGAAVSHDAVALSWEGPAGWSPEGYAVRWRLAGADGPLGRLLLPPGRRAQTVAGLAGGAEYEFTVTARTAAGGPSRPAAVVVATPAAPEGGLVLEVSAPAYCIADEGSVRTQDRIDPDTGRVDLVYQRVGVASLPLQWRVSGGQAPYKLRLPGGERAGAAGAAEVSCAREGLDLDDLPDGEVSVVEAGPKTFTVEATDVTGNTASRTITVEVIEAAHSAGSWHRGDHLEPGRTYSHFGLFIEIPEQARIAYGGAVEADDVYDSFLGPLGGLRITDLLIAPSTGEEAPANIGRTVYQLDEAGGVFPDFGAPLTAAENAFWDRFLAHIRTSPFPEGDPRNEQPAPLARSGGVSGAAVQRRRHHAGGLRRRPGRSCATCRTTTR